MNGIRMHRTGRVPLYRIARLLYYLTGEMNRQECVKRKNIPGDSRHKVFNNGKNDGRILKIRSRIMAGTLYFRCFPAQ